MLKIVLKTKLNTPQTQCTPFMVESKHVMKHRTNNTIHPFDNYVTTTLFSTSGHLKWKGFQVFFSWAMHGEPEHPSSKFWILINKYGNKH